jgi:hypothetical protein
LQRRFETTKSRNGHPNAKGGPVERPMQRWDEGV